MNEQERAEFRAFVREHHPDRGGDPAAFAAGLRRFRAGAPTTPDDDAPAGPADDGPPAAAAPEAGRNGAQVGAPVDAPVDMASLLFPVRVGVALIRTWHRRHEQRTDRPHPPPAPP